jgi:hypothetical protein
LNCFPAMLTIAYMRIDLSKSECKYREGKLNKKTFFKFQAVEFLMSG